MEGEPVDEWGNWMDNMHGWRTYGIIFSKDKPPLCYTHSTLPTHVGNLGKVLDSVPNLFC